jgi:hypothetical protein
MHDFDRSSFAGLQRRAVQRGDARDLEDEEHPLQQMQRDAGNAAVTAALLREEPVRSPVLDVGGRGGGRALDARTRTDMESRGVADRSGVPLHDDAATQRFSGSRRTAPLAARPTLQRAPTATAAPPAPSPEEINRKRTDALSLLVYVNETSAKQFADAKLRMMPLVEGFSDAASSVQSDIAKQDAKDQLNNQIIFSALTLVLTGGAASALEVAGEFAAKNMASALIGAGIGEAASAVGPMARPAAANPGVPSDPLAFKNQMEAIVAANESIVHETNASSALAFHDVTDETWAKWDYGKAKAAMDKLLDARLKPLEKIPAAVPAEGWKIKFEKNLWAQWLANCHISPKAEGGMLFGSAPAADDKYEVRPRFGSHIEKRLTDLSIARAAGVEFSEYWPTSDKDRMKCVNWGIGHQQVIDP